MSTTVIVIKLQEEIQLKIRTQWWNSSQQNIQYTWYSYPQKYSARTDRHIYWRLRVQVDMTKIRYTLLFFQFQLNASTKPDRNRDLSPLSCVSYCHYNNDMSFWVDFSWLKYLSLRLFVNCGLQVCLHNLLIWSQSTATKGWKMSKISGRHFEWINDLIVMRPTCCAQCLSCCPRLWLHAWPHALHALAMSERFKSLFLAQKRFIKQNVEIMFST